MYGTSYTTKDSESFQNISKYQQTIKDREGKFQQERPIGYCHRCEYDAYGCQRK
jgi:hypothetical protein